MFQVLFQSLLVLFFSSWEPVTDLGDGPECELSVPSVLGLGSTFCFLIILSPGLDQSGHLPWETVLWAVP